MVWPYPFFSTEARVIISSVLCDGTKGSWLEEERRWGGGGGDGREKS